MKIGFQIVNDIRKKELTVLILDLFANDRQLTTEVGFYFDFHLHMNNGFEDDHLSLIEYTYPQGDWFSGGILYDHLIKELIVNFPKSRKIFEVKPEYAN
jgi:hypothetical protein